jgi:hypothetical protein
LIGVVARAAMLRKLPLNPAIGMARLLARRQRIRPPCAVHPRTSCCSVLPREHLKQIETRHIGCTVHAAADFDLRQFSSLAAP